MNTENSKMYYELNKKSKGVAYLLWFLLFCLGAHRFYTRNIISAVILLIIWIAAIITFFSSLGLSSVSFYIDSTSMSISGILFMILGIWWIVDAFLTNNNVNKYNTSLAIKVGLLENKDLIK